MTDTEPTTHKYVKLPPLIDRATVSDVCVYCNVPLDADNKSKEHVFPKWLMRNLPNHVKIIKLFDGQERKIQKIFAQCCRNCNNEKYSALEKKMQRLVSGPKSALSESDNLTIFIWAIKLVVGLRISEWCYVNWDSKEYKWADAHAPGIGVLRYLLNCLLPKWNIDSIPSSLQTFILSDHLDEFGFLEDSASSSIAMKIGWIGMITLVDGGAYTRQYLEGRDGFDPSPLTTDAFWAKATAASYAGTKRKRDMRVYMTEDAKGAPFMSFEALPGGDLFDDVDDRGLAAYRQRLSIGVQVRPK